MASALREVNAKSTKMTATRSAPNEPRRYGADVEAFAKGFPVIRCFLP